MKTAIEIINEAVRAFLDIAKEVLDLPDDEFIEMYEELDKFEDSIEERYEKLTKEE